MKPELLQVMRTVRADIRAGGDWPQPLEFAGMLLQAGANAMELKQMVIDYRAVLCHGR